MTSRAPADELWLHHVPSGTVIAGENLAWYYPAEGLSPAAVHGPQDAEARQGLDLDHAPQGGGPGHRRRVLAADPGLARAHGDDLSRRPRPRDPGQCPR